jgi:hypothetical protein
MRASPIVFKTHSNSDFSDKIGKKKTSTYSPTTPCLSALRETNPIAWNYTCAYGPNTNVKERRKHKNGWGDLNPYNI